MRIALLLLAALIGCTELPAIQQLAPIRTVKFAGSHKAIARCIYDRIGGKMMGAEFGEAGDRLIIYDAVKDLAPQGISHYSMTVVKTDSNHGLIEWRVVNLMGVPLTNAMIQQFWIPAQECAH